MNKIITYELNEVSWRVVDYYLSHRSRTNLARFLDKATHLTTHTTDSGELHPWSTWPTMHRGVNNDAHEIRFINQDRSCAQNYPPIWELLVNADVTVGLCGCLQSYPPVRHRNMRFHIPDTFAPGEHTEPARYRGFQAINLRLTSENKAVAQKLSWSDLRNGLSLFNAGVTFKTGARLARHLAQERINPLNKSLRAVMQAHVAFDVFMDALRLHKPRFASIFSNHVAGTMHRYWKYAFPEDFSYQLSNRPFDRFHRHSVLKAMDIFDAQLGVLERFAREHGYQLVIASSMGQEAVERGTYRAELRLDHEQRLAEKMGFSGAFKMNMAMQPDVNLQFFNSERLQEFKGSLGRLLDGEGRQVISVRYQEQGLSLNLKTERSEAAYRENALYLDGRRIPLDELGLATFKRDPGTGYHQPKGILIWNNFSASATPIQDRREIDSQQYAPTILKQLDVPAPPYMQTPAPLQHADVVDSTVGLENIA